MRLRLASLTALTLLALALRLWGIGASLPWHFHPDEPAHVLEPVDIAQSAPHALSFANPPLYKELLLGVYGLTNNLSADTSRLFFVARATSAAIGALVVPATYLLGTSLRGPGVGLTCAALASVAFLLVRESHFAVNDALATLFATLALVGCVRIACSAARREYVLTGALLGLTFAAKYQAAAVALPLLFAWSATRRVRDLLFAGGAALLTSLSVFPSLILEPNRVLADFYVFDVLPARLGYDGLDPSGGYAYYLNALGIGLGWPMLALASVGLIYAAVRRETGLIVVATLPIVLFLVMGASRMYFARFLLPALPSLIVLAAIAISDVVRDKRLGVVLFVLAFGWTARDSVLLDNLLAQPDTRLVAASWIGAQLPPDAPIVADGPPLGVPLPRAELSPAALYDTSLDQYRLAGIEYFVSSSFVNDARPIDPTRDANRRAFAAELPDAAVLLAEFRPSPVDHAFVYDRIYGPYDALGDFTEPGPTIRIYRLKRG